MKIITSNTSHGAFKGIVNEINKHRGFLEENIVLAPDRFTAFVERAILSSLKEKSKFDSTFDIEVVSFTRLANKVLQDDVKKCMTPQGSIMLISQAILNCKSELKFYKKVAGVDGFAKELYAALTALRNSGLSSDDILQQSESVKSLRLKDKLHDIATIFKHYIALLEEAGKNDSTTRLEGLAKRLQDDPTFLKGKRFYCTDIYDFSAPELAILKSIAENAEDFTIAFVSGKGNKNAHIYPDGLDTQENVVKKIERICKGVHIEKEHIDDEILVEPFKTVSEYLFSYEKPENPAEVVQNGAQKICLRSAKNRYDEILRLVVDITKKVREEGGRYKDIEVFVPDLAGYAPDLKAAFLRYDIPFFLDQKELLSEQTKAKYLLLALAVVKSNFRADEVLDFVKNPLFAYNLELGEKEVFAFENYVLKYGLTYLGSEKAFEYCESKDEDPHYQKPNFDVAEVDEKTQNLLTADENVVPKAVYQKLVGVLEPLKSTIGKLDDKRKLRTFVEGCRVFLKNTDEAWTAHVKTLKDLSKFYEKAAEQVDKKLESALDEIEEVLGDSEKTLADFVQIFEAMIEMQKIALVPTYLDCVFVGTSGSRFMALGDVYILGATSGSLPAQTAGGTIITPKEEELLDETASIRITPTTSQKNYTAKYEICDLMKKPRGKLVISYPESLDGASCRRSAVIDELQGMLVKNGTTIDVEKIDFDRIVDSNFEEGERDLLIKGLFATKKASYHEVLRHALASDANSSDMVLYSSAAATIDENDDAKLRTLDEDAKKIECDKKLTKISVSQIEAFYACPYRYYLKYRLGLKERKKGEFLNTDNGTILHSILEQLLRDFRDGVITCSAKEDEINKKVDEYFDIAIKKNNMQYLLQKEHTIRMLGKLKEECHVRAKETLELLSRSKFKPYLLEARIGKGAKGDSVGEFAIKLSKDKKLPVSGYVDRVDKLDVQDGKPMFTIIDYKTFKSITLTLTDVYYGKHVQLYVYMNAVEQNEDMMPAGVFYLPLYESFSKDDDNKPRPRYRFVGHALDDDEVLNAMDEYCETEEGRKKALPPFTDSGSKGNSASCRFLPPESIKAVGDYAVKIVAKGVEAIDDGFIKALPSGDACDNCEFQDTCSYFKTDARSTPAIKSIDELK